MNLWWRARRSPVVPDLDSVVSAERHREILADKGFLRRIYLDWYRAIQPSLPENGGDILEIGSGSGFLGAVLQDAVTSDVRRLPGITVVLDGQDLPFADACLRAIVMTNVLHHMPNVRRFFSEAERCLSTNGVISMVEPWVTPFSCLIYQYLHHEPFEPRRPNWEFLSSGPQSDANGALPWMVLQRDAQRFQREFPGLSVKEIRPIMPVRYLLSGGVGSRFSLPACLHSAAKAAERLAAPWWSKCAMFAHLTIHKTPG